MTTTAFPINASSGSPAYSSQMFRQAMGVLLSPGAAGLQAQPGVRPGPGLDVTVSGTTITVTAGVCVVQGGSATTQGPYMLYADANTTLTLTAADGTNPRVDLIYARVRDTDADASGSRDGTILYLAGTASASPVAPTPASTPSYTVLATISVPKSGGGSPAVSYAARPYTAAAGGLTTGTVAPPSPYIGQLWDSGDGTRRWDGTQWGYLVYTPSFNTQQAAPPFNTTGTFVDFLSASWAPITVTVPPSGKVRVTVSGDIMNTNSGTSTCHATWRASGALTVAAGPYNSLTVYGSRLAGSRTRLLGGATVGASLTVTPQWNISSGNSGTAAIAGGTLEVQPVP